MVSGFRQQLYRSLEPSERSIIDKFYDMSFDEQREHVAKSYKWLTTQFNNKEMWDGFTPWDHQQEAVINAAKHASNQKNDPHFIYEIPTGGGKTTVFIEQNIACAIKDENTGRRIAMPSIIIVPTEKLATDTQKRFKKEYPDMPVGIYYGREKDIKPLTVMTIDSYVSAVESGFIHPEDVIRMDIDEAHRGLSELRQGTSNKFKGNTIISAFSATPIFDAMKNVFDFLGKSNVVARVSLKRLIKDKVVAPINNYILNVHIDYDKEKYTPEAQEQIIAVARLSAAYEFMNEGKDPETGKGFAGDTTLMYLNKTKNSVNGAKYFNDRIERDKGEKKPFTKFMG